VGSSKQGFNWYLLLFLCQMTAFAFSLSLSEKSANSVCLTHLAKTLSSKRRPYTLHHALQSQKWCLLYHAQAAPSTLPTCQAWRRLFRDPWCPFPSTASWSICCDRGRQGGWSFAMRVASTWGPWAFTGSYLEAWVCTAAFLQCRHSQKCSSLRQHLVANVVRNSRSLCEADQQAQMLRLQRGLADGKQAMGLRTLS